MLTKLGRAMHEQSDNFNKVMENITKVPNRNHRAEEYNN